MPEPGNLMKAKMPRIQVTANRQTISSTPTAILLTKENGDVSFSHGSLTYILKFIKGTA
jgi:hypothetical protein